MCPEEVVDLASASPLGFRELINVSNALKEYYGTNVFSLDARESTSYKLINYLSKRGVVKIISSDTWYWGDEVMYELCIQFSERHSF